MQQDKIYTLKNPNEEGHDFYLIPNFGENGLILYIFDEEPSKDTEPDQAAAVIELNVEDDVDATRVQIRLWDDETGNEELATHIITLIQEDK
jgi:hypothetical protein